MIDEISGVSGAYINVQHAGKATLHDPAFMPDPACRFVGLCEIVETLLPMN
ncbi:hypothetical protein WKW50_22045 [Ochrobactrum sp. GPK 3]|uniref:hypothetical protein n=1 Tax=Brucella sp. 22210 TaxID=3453892 RepID=UPI0031384B44